MNSSTNSKRIAKNSILLTIRLVITMCISFYTSRVVLSSLGVEDFGVYNVVGGFVALFTSLTDSLGRALSRFLTVAIAKNDVNEQKQIFSSYVNIQFLLLLLIILISELIGVWYFDTIVNVPDFRKTSVGVVFQLSLLAFVLSLCRTPSISMIIASERSGVYALFGIIDALLKLSVAYVISMADGDKLIVYTILLSLVSFISLLLPSTYCRYYFNGFRYVRNVDKALYKSIFGFASWSLVGISARVFNTQGVVLIVNKYCGVIVNAAMGVVSQVDACTRQFVSNLGVAINPQIVKSYATGNITFMKRLIIFASKCYSFIVLLYAIPLSIEAEYLLKLWLEVVPDFTIVLLRMTFINTLFIVMANPLEIAAQATGSIGKFQSYTSIFLIGLLPAIVVVFSLGYSVYAAYLILIMSNALIVLVQHRITRSITGISTVDYLVNVYCRTVLAALIPTVLAYCVSQLAEPSFVRVVLTSIISVSACLISIFTIGFTKNEASFLISFIKSSILKK